MGKLHDGTCEAPFLTSESAAAPLHFLYRSIGGIWLEWTSSNGIGLHLAARFDLAGVIFGQFSMGKLHDGTCEAPFLAPESAVAAPPLPLWVHWRDWEVMSSGLCLWFAFWRPVLTRPG